MVFLGLRVEDLVKFAVKDEASSRIFCTICRIFSHACSKSNVVDHIESKHFNGAFSHFCKECGKYCKTRNALKGHRKRCTGAPDSADRLFGHIDVTDP